MVFLPSDVFAFLGRIRPTLARVSNMHFHPKNEEPGGRQGAIRALKLKPPSADEAYQLR